MKIARVIYEWPPPWDLSIHAIELTKAQIKLGHTFEVFSARWPKAGPLETPPNVKVNYVWRAPLEGTAGITSSIMSFLQYFFWRKNNEIDLLHTHGHFGVWILFYRSILKKFFPWAKELHVPHVAHFHNTVAGRKKTLVENGVTPKPISKFLDWPISEFSDKLAVKNAQACIFVSDATRLEAIKYYDADPSKCYVVESGVNITQFKKTDKPEREITRDELGFTNLDKVVLYTGKFVERKNIHLLIEALTLLPQEYKLLLLGAGDALYIDRLDSMIDKLNLKERVIKGGYTPYPQMHIAYQSADIFVIPSSWEGLPKSVMEALACEIPVLASGFKTQEHINGLVYLESVTAQEIADQIRIIVENPPLVDVIKIIHDHSWDAKAKQVESIYNNVKENYLK